MLPGYGFSVRATQPNLPGDWPTFGNGPAHMGYFPGRLNGCPFVFKWKTPVPANIISQPAIGGGRVYVSARSFSLSDPTLTLRALDAATGQPLWTNVISSTDTVSPPTYDSGAVYMQRISVNPSYIHSFDAATGNTNWSTPFDSQSFQYMAPVVGGGRVFADIGHVHGLGSFDQVSGTQQWFVVWSGFTFEQWAPAYYNGKVYTWNNNFTERNPVNGAVNWSVSNGLSGDASRRTVAIADQRAYFIGDKLYCVNLATKTNEWAVSGGFNWTPAVANGIVYAISNQYVSAFTTNGVFVRQFGPTSLHGEHYGPLIVTDDVLIAVSTTGVYIYRLVDGSIQQEISGYDPSCFCYQSAVIGLANNTLYVSSGDRNVYAYAATPTTAVTLTSSGRSGNGNFSFRFTNTSGATFTAWATTNVALPLPSWTPLGYVPEISSGQYQFLDTNTPANAWRFYRVSSP
jgi:hypothetical protein